MKQAYPIHKVPNDLDGNDSCFVVSVRIGLNGVEAVSNFEMERNASGRRQYLEVGQERSIIANFGRHRYQKYPPFFRKS